MNALTDAPNERDKRKSVKPDRSLVVILDPPALDRLKGYRVVGLERALFDRRR
jgi:hypothetical protein